MRTPAGAAVAEILARSSKPNAGWMRRSLASAMRPVNDDLASAMALPFYDGL
jgi:hypothetical protein